MTTLSKIIFLSFAMASFNSLADDFFYIGVREYKTNKEGRLYEDDQLYKVSGDISKSIGCNYIRNDGTLDLDMSILPHESIGRYTVFAKSPMALQGKSNPYVAMNYFSLRDIEIKVPSSNNENVEYFILSKESVTDSWAVFISTDAFKGNVRKSIDAKVVGNHEMWSTKDPGMTCAEGTWD